MPAAGVVLSCCQSDRQDCQIVGVPAAGIVLSCCQSDRQDCQIVGVPAADVVLSCHAASLTPMGTELQLISSELGKEADD